MALQKVKGGGRVAEGPGRGTTPQRRLWLWANFFSVPPEWDQPGEHFHLVLGSRL